MNSKLNRLTSICILILAMSFALACNNNKSYTNDGVTITLTNQYSKSEVEQADWSYESPNAIVTGTKETKDELEKAGMEDVDSISAYAISIAEKKGLKSSDVKVGNGYLYFDLTKKIGNSSYSYRTCVYDKADAYWVISFACYKELFDSQKKQFKEFADSVVIE